jgi:hypothetical protein
MRALALIIGNSKYEGEDLITPENDANDIADKLKNFGFVVKKDTNVDYDRFNRLIDSFGSELNKYDIGLFYFAGHGLQIDGDNFLTTSNTNFESEVSVKYSSITLYKIIDYMHRAKNETNIIILDACRDNPFEKRWSRSIKISGLAPLYAPKGTLIAFATSPGETALNGKGRNGLYTHCLLNHLDEPNIPIEELFKRVRNSVFAFSEGKQTTWEHTSLTGKYVFNSGNYIQASTSKYSSDVIADKNYISTGSEIDNTIEELKSHNWYKQSPAVKKINDIKPQDQDKNKLFILGRNLLQTAHGGEWAAQEFFQQLPNNIKKFLINGENHLLNGILFEIYFNSEGKFRSERLKLVFFDEIIELSKNPDYSSSFTFINEQLQPFTDELFFIPSPQMESFSIDVVLEKEESDKLIEYKVLDIKSQGVGLLKKLENSWFTRDDNEIYYEPYTFDRFQEKISFELGVPKKMLTINTNFKLNIYSKILYPFGYNLTRK